MSVVKYMKKRLSLCILSAICISTAIIAQVVMAKSNDKAQSASTQSTAVLVNAAVVKTANIPNTISALGSLSAKQSVTISSEVEGRIDQIFFKNGQLVAKGMPIIKLDDASAQADYEQAVTKLNLDTKNYQRMKLVGDAVSQQDLEEAKATVKSDQADVSSKLAALHQKEINAPFTGKLGSFQVSVGDYVSAGQAMVPLVNTKELRADYTISEDLIPEIKLGQLIKLTVSAYPNQNFYGTVNFISPSVDPTTRAVAIQALVNNNDEKLSPGMFIHISQELNVDKGAVVVPEDAVSANIKGHLVFKINNGHAEQVQVNVGNHNNGMVQVLSGLKPGDVIVVAGQQKLSDGSAVKILNQADVTAQLQSEQNEIKAKASAPKVDATGTKPTTQTTAQSNASPNTSTNKNAQTNSQPTAQSNTTTPSDAASSNAGSTNNSTNTVVQQDSGENVSAVTPAPAAAASTPAAPSAGAN